MPGKQHSPEKRPAGRFGPDIDVMGGRKTGAARRAARRATSTLPSVLRGGGGGGGAKHRGFVRRSPSQALRASFARLAPCKEGRSKAPASRLVKASKLTPTRSSCFAGA